MPSQPPGGAECDAVQMPMAAARGLDGEVLITYGIDDSRSGLLNLSISFLDAMLSFSTGTSADQVGSGC